MVEPSTAISLYSSPAWEVSQKLQEPAGHSDSSKISFHVPQKTSPKVFVFQLESFQLLYSMTTQLIHYIQLLQNDHRGDHVAQTILRLHQLLTPFLLQ